MIPVADGLGGLLGDRGLGGLGVALVQRLALLAEPGERLCLLRQVQRLGVDGVVREGDDDVGQAGPGAEAHRDVVGRVVGGGLDGHLGALGDASLNAILEVVRLGAEFLQEIDHRLLLAATQRRALAGELLELGILELPLGLRGCRLALLGGRTVRLEAGDIPGLDRVVGHSDCLSVGPCGQPRPRAGRSARRCPEY